PRAAASARPRGPPRASPRAPPRSSTSPSQPALDTLPTAGLCRNHAPAKAPVTAAATGPTRRPPRPRARGPHRRPRRRHRLRRRRPPAPLRWHRAKPPLRRPPQVGALGEGGVLLVHLTGLTPLAYTVSSRR